MPSSMTENDFRKQFGYKPREKQSLLERVDLSAFIPTRSTLFNVLPILTWLPKYKIKKWLLADVISGLTVGTMHIPQGMAYAALAGLPPVYGLYTGFFPVLIYTILGTSRHISVGPYALTSLMIGASIEGLVPSPAVQQGQTSANITADWSAVYDERLSLASAITFFVGLFLIIFSVFHLGSVTRLFARPVQSGFICAVAFLTVLSQVKSLLGVRVGSHSGTFASIWVIGDIGKALTSLDSKGLWNTTASIVTSITCILFLVAVKLVNERYREKFPFHIPIPGEMLVVMFGTFISWFADLENTHHVLVVGSIPSGLPVPKFPNVSHFGSVAVQSLVVAVIGYSVAVSLAKTFAENEGYRVRPNQELLALGSCNFFGSFFSCIPGFASMSRTCVQRESGGKTELVGWFASFLMLFVLLFIGPLFKFLPKACLASIVVVAISGLFKHTRNLKRYWTNHKPDALTWSITCLGTILFHVIVGLLCGIAVQLLFSVMRTSYVKLRRLERIGITQVYKEKGCYQKAIKLNERIVLTKFYGPLNFFNGATLRRSIVEESGVDPVLMTKTKTIETNGRLHFYENKALPSTSEELNTDIALNQEVSPPNPVIVTDQTKTPYAIDVIILDCSGMSSVDAVGSDIFAKIIADYKEINMEFLLANCSENILECLDAVSEYDIKEIAYVTIHDAVEAAQTICLAQRSDCAVEEV